MTTQWRFTSLPKTDNPFQDTGRTFDECMQNGAEAQQEGALGQAIFWFEAAVQKNGASAAAWQALGEWCVRVCGHEFGKRLVDFYIVVNSQSENEQDSSAIAALRESVRLAPNNHRVYLSLATSLTNEVRGIGRSVARNSQLTLQFAILPA
jgi:hypothetical protein